MGLIMRDFDQNTSIGDSSWKVCMRIVNNERQKITH